jgi:hypothetical protein
MNREDWLPCLEQNLTATTTEGNSFSVELLENKSLGKKSEATQEAYSLVFRGPHEELPEQGLISLKHKAIGTIEVFMVPIGSDEQGMCYEAIFA